MANNVVEDEKINSPQAQVSHSSRSLTPKVPANLLQGVPVRCVLARAGRALRISSFDPRARKKLRRCSNFDIFISHDWGTSGWLKYASLLVFLNSCAAAIATLLVSLTVGVLIAFGVLPNHPLMLSIGYFTFMIFCCFWQHIRDMFRTPKLAFLDKLAIPQEDEGLKEQCILGLAGFLDHSRKLVVLFSGEYIGRLWCLYELTAFLKMRSSGDVQTVPVVLPLLLLLHAAWWSAVRLLVFLLWQTSVNIAFSLAGGAVIFLVTYPLQAWVGLRLTKSLQRLSRELRKFDITQTKCSCCSAGHVKANGDQIPCDRVLIYQRLTEWYGDQSGLDHPEPDTFKAVNTAVRTQFADLIRSTCGPRILPMNLFIYTIFSMNTPYLIVTLPDAIARAQEKPSTYLAFVSVVRSMVGNNHYWPAMLIYFWACKTMWTLTLKFDRWPLFIGVASAVFVLLSWFFASGLIIVSTLLAPEDSWWPPLVAFVLVTALGLWLVRASKLPIRGMDEVEEFEDVKEAHNIRDDVSSLSSFSI